LIKLKLLLVSIIFRIGPHTLNIINSTLEIVKITQRNNYTTTTAIKYIPVLINQNANHVI